MAATEKARNLRFEKQANPLSLVAPSSPDDPANAATAAEQSARPGADAQTPTAALAADHAAQSRREAIAQAAYFLAQARGFEPGHELDDWLSAEQQIDAAGDRQQ